ncbi:MAG TPA: hypothetical protein PKY01_17570 [Candidatus Hydrogenedentes bacterium]|nr:hypothetical protein [Candidatus Hydrogenedentota bacterium]
MPEFRLSKPWWFPAQRPARGARPEQSEYDSRLAYYVRRRREAPEVT